MQGALAGGCECYSRLAGNGHCFTPSRRDRRALNKGARRRRGPALYDSATPCLAHNGHLHCTIQPHRTACYLGVQVLPQRGYTLAVVSLLQYRLVAWKHATPIASPTSKDPFTAVLGHCHTHIPLQRAVYHTMARFWQGLCSFATGLQSSGVVLPGALFVKCCCTAPAKARTCSTATHDLQRTGVVQMGFLCDALLENTSHFTKQYFCVAQVQEHLCCTNRQAVADVFMSCSLQGNI